MQLDMNLLVALDALLDTGSVGGAAARMHVSSPAMSRTLDRIRHMTGDAVLVRAGRHMTPTPYAESIRDEVRAIVARAQAVLAREQRFDPALIERHFTVQCHDALACALGQGLLADLRRTAPHVKLRLLAEDPFSDAPMLRHGDVDLHIGAALPTQSDVSHSLLGHDTLVVAMRVGHPLLKRKLSKERYAAAEHVIVSRRGRLRDRVDETLSSDGLARSVVASAPSAASALCMVSASDLLVTVPSRGCASMARALALGTATLPLTVPALPVISTWHVRHDGDRAHVWLREEVARIAKGMLASA
ncbi:LysR family transcriptional regulator [Robbsia sp. KACC 23696]|uniref:LysR family transcriptional regulator n=1 Tax=Robbsia sp. KACC 23696 TaxID=3149231 RepID=UPI00325B1790